jgi:hypothetical protein
MYCKRCESGDDYIYMKDNKLVCSFCEEYHPNEDPSSEIVDNESKDNSEYVDYIDYLKPIIKDVKDGSKEPLTQDDVNFIMSVCRAKIEFHEGLITQEQYETCMNNVN